MVRGSKKVKAHSIRHERDIQIKIIGVIFMIVGLLLLLTPTPLFLKFSFTLILIGVVLILLITEQSVPRKISTAQIQGSLAFINKIINELEITGNAVFLPKSPLLSEERVFIPTQKNTMIPYIDDEIVVTTGGLALPPAGLTLLKKIETETTFNRIGLDNIEEGLQTFVGMNIFKSVQLKKATNGWKLELERLEPCNLKEPTCAQYPCAGCSAVLTAITQATQEKIWITDAAVTGNKTIFHLKIG